MKNETTTVDQLKKIVCQLKAFQADIVIDSQKEQLEDLININKELKNVKQAHRGLDELVNALIRQRKKQLQDLLPDHQKPMSVPLRYECLRDELFKSWQDSETPPLLTARNILPEFQYTLDRYQKAVIEGWFNCRLTKTITITVATYYDELIDAEEGCQSFTVKNNRQGNVIEKYNIYDAKAFFTAVQQMRACDDADGKPSELERKIELQLSPLRAAVEVAIPKKPNANKKTTKKSKTQQMLDKYADV